MPIRPFRDAALGMSLPYAKFHAPDFTLGTAWVSPTWDSYDQGKSEGFEIETKLTGDWVGMTVIRVPYNGIYLINFSFNLTNQTGNADNETWGLIDVMDQGGWVFNRSYTSAWRNLISAALTEYKINPIALVTDIPDGGTIFAGMLSGNGGYSPVVTSGNHGLAITRLGSL